MPAAAPALPSAALVLGAGASGRAAARALLRRGVPVGVSVPAPDPAADALAALGAEVLVGDPAANVAAWARRHPGSAAVFSPGIPPAAPEWAAARAAGLRAQGELCLGCGLLHPATRLVALTGSKGKSSVAKLLADALRAAGRPAVPCGNYGTPVCEVADLDPPPAFAVAECSSFQLETADARLAPEAALLLNLSSDHLDRHGSLAAYLNAKLAIFAAQPPGALALLPEPGSAGPGAPDPLARFRERFPGREAETFGTGPDARWRWRPGAVEDAAAGLRIPLSGSYFDNAVLGPAAAAAAAILLRLGLAPGAVSGALRNFVPLPHRMQRVALRDGVAWIDNSKATSLAALLASVRMAPAPVLLVAGGRLKEPLAPLGKELLDSGVRKAYTIGECGGAMARAWSSALPVEDCATLERACAAAARDAAALRAGCVLLAPGTASFDQFPNYAARGDAFARLARSP